LEIILQINALNWNFWQCGERVAEEEDPDPRTSSCIHLLTIYRSLAGKLKLTVES
jgi:hypothetical protein